MTITPDNQGPLSQEMRCGIFSNSQGKVMIIHDKKLKNDLDYIEYDEHEKKISLIYMDGSLQDLGIDIPPDMLKDMSAGQEVDLLHLINGKITSSLKTVFLWRY